MSARLEATRQYSDNNESRELREIRGIREAIYIYIYINVFAFFNREYDEPMEEGIIN